jgi:hypothetical protein
MFNSGVSTNKNVGIVSLFNSSETNNNETLYCNLINHTDVRKLVGYYYEFSVGNIDSLNKKLTLNEYNTLSLTLNNLKRFDDPNSCYELLRLNLVRSLESLMKGLNIYNNLTAYKNNEPNYEKWRITYFNQQKLLDRYNELQKSAVSFFDDLNVDAPLLTIKPEYYVYIRKYGYPQTGIFDSEKIANILESLN